MVLISRSATERASSWTCPHGSRRKQSKPWWRLNQTLAEATVRRDVHGIAKALRKRFGLKPRSIRVAEFVTGWGSCGPSGTIHIDWRLVFAPKRVLEYVVVHELAHLKHRSHGEEFWAFLGSMLPDHERPKGWLDTHQGALDALRDGTARFPSKRRPQNETVRRLGCRRMALR